MGNGGSNVQRIRPRSSRELEDLISYSKQLALNVRDYEHQFHRNLAELTEEDIDVDIDENVDAGDDEETKFQTFHSKFSSILNQDKFRGTENDIDIPSTKPDENTKNLHGVHALILIASIKCKKVYTKCMYMERAMEELRKRVHFQKAFSESLQMCDAIAHGCSYIKSAIGIMTLMLNTSSTRKRPHEAIETLLKIHESFLLLTGSHEQVLRAARAFLAMVQLSPSKELHLLLVMSEKIYEIVQDLSDAIVQVEQCESAAKVLKLAEGKTKRVHSALGDAISSKLPIQTLRLVAGSTETLDLDTTDSSDNNVEWTFGENGGVYPSS
jgi:hypothetical protein